MEEAVKDDKINVLVIGNSGAGKSTLINAIIKKDEALEWTGNTGTKTIKPYECEGIPFRLVDTRGLEYGFIPQLQTKMAIDKWCRDGIKTKNGERYIHAIWYCLDASSKRLFKENLDSIYNVAKMWHNVPIIIVITKSYSEVEDEANIRMVRGRLENYGNKLNVEKIISVVAKPYPINNEIVVAPKGLEELIESTNQMIPEARQISRKSLSEFEIRIKDNTAAAFVAAMTSAAAAVGAVPIPVADSMVLVPLQTAMVSGITHIYKLDKDSSKMKKLVETIAGTSLISQLGRTCVSMIKAIPGLNIAGSVIDAFIAASITATLGGISIAVMDKIAKGEINADDYEWIENFVHDEAAGKIGKYMQKVDKDSNIEDSKKAGKIVSDIFSENEKK